MFKDIVTKCVALVILLVLMLAMSLACRAADEPVQPFELLKEYKSTEEKAKPAIKQDVKDVVITLEITINGCDDVHSTSVKEYSGVYYLHYSVVQNLDSFIRMEKKITLEWRLKDKKVEDIKYQVAPSGYWTPTNEELMELEPKLKQLEKH